MTPTPNLDRGSEGGPPRPKVWIDAQLPPSLADWLESEHDVDASHVQDLGLLTASDSTIFAAASSEGSVILVTKDADFPKLLDQRGPPPVVVWVRTGNVSNRELRRVVLQAWPRARALLEAGETLVEIRRDPDGAT